jgi:aminopeptidase N
VVNISSFKLKLSLILERKSVAFSHVLHFRKHISFTGFYRANYDSSNWGLLTEYLMDRDHFTQIGIINRAQLLDDALNLARAGLLDYATALDVTRYLANELEYLPWKAALNAVVYIDSMLVKTGNYDKFKVCMCNI